MITGDFISALEGKLLEKFNSNIRVINTRPVSGGCINNAVCLETGSGKFFLKWNTAKRYPGMFNAEAHGLELLRSTQTLVIPEVIAQGEYKELSYLILEWIEPGKRQKRFWKNFGEQLAKLHGHSSSNFGLDHENYIGSLHQRNHPHSSWYDFFISERIEPQLTLAIEQGRLADRLISSLAHLQARLPEIIPEEKPALLHGDLWNGNFMVAQDGAACLLDPAVYFGHREMDLAMTKLFGGFDQAFHEAYHEVFPLEEGFDERADIHTLYPLLVHVNLFGGGYVGQVNNILSRFC